MYGSWEKEKGEGEGEEGKGKVVEYECMEYDFFFLDVILRFIDSDCDQIWSFILAYLYYEWQCVSVSLAVRLFSCDTIV